MNGAIGATGAKGPQGPAGAGFNTTTPYTRVYNGSGVFYYNSTMPYPAFTTLTATAKAYCSIKFTAPSNGTVHLIATCFGQCIGNGSGYSFGIGASPSTYDSVAASGPVDNYYGSAGSMYYYPSTTQIAYNFIAGHNYTYYVLAHQWFGLQTTQLSNIALSATFYPK